MPIHARAYSLPTQQIVPVVTDTYARWQRLPKTHCHCEAV